MKSIANFFTASALALVFAFPATAADKKSPAPRPGSDSMAMSRSETGRLDRPDSPAKASDLIGLKLENREGQKIGSVDDLAIDLQAGRVVQVIVSTGGFLSMGQRNVAVPPGLLRFDAAGKPLRLDLTADRLKQAPAFEMSRWTEFYQSDGVRDSELYFSPNRSVAASPAGTEAAMMPDRTTGAAPGLGFVQKATKLMGLSVRNLSDEKIGSVENLIVDLPAGRIVAVIVSSGGFLGLGDTLSVVPPTALRFNDEHTLVRLDTTKEALRDAPRFKSGEWPDFSQREYAEGIYGAYRVKPYFSRERDGAAAPDADNSVRNARDRENRSLTAGDQSNATSDVKITQQIRQDITAADGFSVNAKNVKIITVNGRVTLRGPVRTAEEKQRIGEMAARAAPAEHIDNQLEVIAR